MPRTCLNCGLETEDEIDVCPNDGTPLKNKSRDPLIGTLFLNKYEITDLLGRGGMSAVYKGRQMLMDRWVAIKVLRSEMVQDPLSLKRFQQESKAASMLSHPNVIGVHDFDVTSDGVPYLIMDYVDGKPVSSILRREGQIHPARCVFLFSQACSALAHAHSKGVVHRDIKPSNLMVIVDENEVETIKLVDFGIAKLLEFNSDKPRLTMTGEIFGSPTYMSPEQCGGKTIDARSDIYSLGCVIYECLMGVPPIRGETLLETIYKHVNEAPAPFHEVRPDLNSIPKALEKVVLKSLEKLPEQRYQTMIEFDNELRASYRDYIKEVTAARTKPSVLAGATVGADNLGAVEQAADSAAPARKALSLVSFTGQIADRNFACTACEKANPLGLLYCQYCGEKATDPDRAHVNGKRSCPKCSSTDALNSHFCTSCGTTLAAQLKKQTPGLNPAVLIGGLIVVLAGGSLYVWQSHRQPPPVPVKETQPPAPGDEKKPAAQNVPAASSVITLDDPWIKVHTRQVIGTKTQEREPTYGFRDGDQIFYTVQALPAMPVPCYIYVMHKDQGPAKVIFRSGDPLAKSKTIPVSEAHSTTKVEPFLLKNGPLEDKLVVVASPKAIARLDKNDYCDPIFLKALACVGLNPPGVEVAESDIGVGPDTKPSLSLTYLTTNH